MPSVTLSLDKPSIPTSYSLLLAAEMGLQERSLGALLMGTQISAEQLTSDTTLLTATQQIQIIRNSLRILGDHGVGLRLGKRLTPPTHGALGFLANSSPDLDTVINTFQEFLPTRMCFIRLVVESDTQWLHCHFNIDLQAEEPIYRIVIEAVSLALLSIVEFVLGRPLAEGRLCVNYPAPHYVNLYSQYIPCPVNFSASDNELLIPLALRYTPNATANHENYDLALQQCQAMFKQLPQERETVRHRVQAYMLTHPPGQISEEGVAASMFITKRTLARRLQQEGYSYRQLRDEIFASLAERYLRDSTLSVEAIAGLLGYHDSANFRRAFKRWLNKTPSQYREDIGRG